MASRIFWLCSFAFGCVPVACIILVIPEDVPAGFATIFGFTPRLVKGNDHRFGFGFNLGPHADFQIMYELGPQTRTKSLQQVKVRSASYRKRVVRWPILNFLNLGLFKRASYEVNLAGDVHNEPR